ncbi:MAG TPA: YdeI/OmpD-associated family protein [Candidatus Saccharimonadales bacterium]|nr:YdeI/OmpD-associated family protein [Candidatus Saccharimonadales bacterium]
MIEKVKPDYEIIAFKNAADWRRWLDEHHATIDGVWLKIYKKASNAPTVTYAEALDDALCYGWIDGQKKSYDEVSFLQKFTPRRTKSMWSKRNIEYIARLTEQKRMMPAGLAQVEQAQRDGRWAAAYDKPSDMVVPEYFLAELKEHPIAEKFFATLNKANTFAIAWRLQTAKTEETRRRRMDKILALLDSEEKLH